MEDTNRKLRQSFENLKRALNRLEEALNENQENSLIVDGTILRFKFTTEIYWKTLKRLLLSEGIDAKTPRETLKEAYQVGWLTNEQAWLQMSKRGYKCLKIEIQLHMYIMKKWHVRFHKTLPVTFQK